MTKQNIIHKLNKTISLLLVHDDNVPGSAFSSRIDDLYEIRKELSKETKDTIDSVMFLGTLFASGKIFLKILNDDSYRYCHTLPNKGYEAFTKYSELKDYLDKKYRGLGYSFHPSYISDTFNHIKGVNHEEKVHSKSLFKSNRIFSINEHCKKENIKVTDMFLSKIKEASI